MTASVNAVTGEVTVEVSGATFKLRASMARVGELETALGVDGFSGIQEQLSRVSASVTLKALRALCVSDNAAALDDVQYADHAAALDAVWKALAAGLPDAKEKKSTTATVRNGEHRGRDTAPLPLAS